VEQIAIYPGSFDPVTYGHLDLIRRAGKIFSHLVIAVVQNIQKHALFTAEERAEMLSKAIGNTLNVEVDIFSGLLVDYAKKRRASIIVRGLRVLSDFEYEFQMAHMNRHLDPDLETFFMMTGHDHFYVTSQIVKEVAYFGGDVSTLVPDVVLKALSCKFNKLSSSID
jgi:pantetheine-phosphate adenylyltransferase